MYFSFELILIFGLPVLMFIVFSGSGLFFLLNRHPPTTVPIDNEVYSYSKKNFIRANLVAIIIGLTIQTLVTLYLIKIAPSAPNFILFQFITVVVCLILLYGSFHFLSRYSFKSGKIEIFKLSCLFFKIGFNLIPLLSGIVTLYMLALISGGP